MFVLQNSIESNSHLVALRTITSRLTRGFVLPTVDQPLRLIENGSSQNPQNNPTLVYLLRFPLRVRLIRLRLAQDRDKAVLIRPKLLLYNLILIIY